MTEIADHPAAAPACSARRAADVEGVMSGMARMKRRLLAAAPAEMAGEVEGITPHQLEALVGLMAQPDGVTMNDLARAQGVALSSATALADRLVRNGLAERGGDPADRRVVRLLATPAARAAAERFQAGRRALFLDMMRELSDGEVAELNRLINALAAAGTTGDRA